MGGFSSNVRACRWQIPKEYWGRVYINLLELYAELVSIWIDIVEDALDGEECLLSMGDITKAIGWIHKAHKLAPNEHPHLTLRKNETPNTTGIPDH